MFLCTLMFHRFRFTDMVKWMDAVDRSLENVLKDLLTIEEFESERAVFQVKMTSVLKKKYKRIHFSHFSKLNL